MNFANRFEFKYVLDPVTALMAKHMVSRMMQPDKPYVNSEGWYPVTSLYFETPGLTDYYEKSGGFVERKKLRARIYAQNLTPDMPVRIEIKKKYDMAVVKTNTFLTPQDWKDLEARNLSRLLARGRPPQTQKALDEFMWYMLQEGRRPMYFIRYKRYAYVIDVPDDDNDLRITFDEHIESNQQFDFSEPIHATHTSERTIMEVKFHTHVPPWFAVMERKLGLRRDTFSKYARSVEALNKFNPPPR